MISGQNWPKHKKIRCKNVQFKIGLNAKCAIVQNWPVHGKPVQNDDQYKFGTNANSAGTKQSVQNVPVQIGQNIVSTSHLSNYPTNLFKYSTCPTVQVFNLFNCPTCPIVQLVQLSKYSTCPIVQLVQLSNFSTPTTRYIVLQYILMFFLVYIVRTRKERQLALLDCSVRTLKKVSTFFFFIYHFFQELFHDFLMNY